jgi:hypothetical protein
MLLLTLLVISVVIVQQGGVSFPNEPGPKFDNSISPIIPDALAAQKSDMILLGDSVVELNLNPPALEKALGLTIYPLHFNGSSSTLWYVAIKNVIVTSPSKPRYLVIVFRDTFLTTPAYRAQGGGYQDEIDSLATQEDSLVIQRTYVNQMNLLEKASESYFPLYVYRARIRNQIDYLIRYPLIRATMNCGKRCLDIALDTVLNGRNWDPILLNTHIAGVEDVLYTRHALDFKASVNESYLPDIIRLCKENDIRPIFVHAKTLRLYRNAYEPVLLAAYLRDLADYLRANGVSYLDIGQDPRIKPEDFADSLHIFPAAIDRYTQVLADALKTVLP